MLIVVALLLAIGNPAVGRNVNPLDAFPDGVRGNFANNGAQVAALQIVVLDMPLGKRPRSICRIWTGLHSHVERHNLTLRTFVKRMARLPCCFSKKWANHEAMIGLAIAHYNFCRVHGTLKATPAVATGSKTTSGPSAS